MQEELWAAWRSLPPASSALLQVRDLTTISCEDQQLLQRALTALESSELTSTLADAQHQFARRDGPPPLHRNAFAALLLSVGSVCESGDLVAAMPLSAPLLSRTAHNLGAVLHEEIESARELLQVMVSGLKCCGCRKSSAKCAS